MSAGGQVEPTASEAPGVHAATVAASVPAEGTTGSASTPGAVDDGWVRVHPASPWVRGWAFLAGILVVGGREVIEDMAGRWFGVRESAESAPGEGGLLIGAAILLGVTLLVCLVFLFSWWFTRFRVGEEEIELRRGWLFRSRRQMKYDRIQAVDLQYPLLARLLGLAAVKIEAADGGGDSALELAYLKKAQAARVRREILDRASGALVGPASAPRPVPGPDAGEIDVAGSEAPSGRAPLRGRVRELLADPEDEGTVMLRVPTGRLIGSVLLSDAVVGVVAGFLAFAAAMATVLALLPAEPGDAEEVGVLAILAGTALPIAFALVSAVWSGLNQGWGFTVRTSDDGLRLRYGLTETTAQTVPPGRVQGVTVSQPLFWRPFGWHKVKVSVAGYGDGEGGSQRDVALPVGPWEDVLRVLSVVAPDPGLDDDPRAADGLDAAGLMRLALTGAGEEGGFRHVPRRARWWFNWFTWRRHGYTFTRTLLVVRHGRFSRRFQTLQHERVQDVALTQGPVQRRLDVARLTVHLAGGGSAAVDDLDAGVLRELFEVESRHAAVSRRLADRNRWMLPEELERFERRTAEVAESAVGRRELAAVGVAPEEARGAEQSRPTGAGTEEETR